MAPGSASPSGSGGGSSDVVPVYTVAPVEGIRNALTDLGNTTAQVRLVLVDDANQTATIDGAERAPSPQLWPRRRDADAVVVMAGTISEEGADRATFADTTGQDSRRRSETTSTGTRTDSNVIATVGQPTRRRTATPSR